MTSRDLDCSPFRGVQNRINPIEKPQIEPTQNRKKPHLAWMYSDHFFAQPHGLDWFAVFISPTEPNQTKPNQIKLQHKKNSN